MRIHVADWIRCTLVETARAFLVLKDQELSTPSEAESKDELREALLSVHSPLKSHLTAKAAADATS